MATPKKTKTPGANKAAKFTSALTDHALDFLQDPKSKALTLEHPTR